jgi:hypothetical protein
MTSDETTASARVPQRARKEKVARLLAERFNQSERESLVRSLGEDPEDIKLKPETRRDFTWAMVEHFVRRGRFDELCVAVEQAVRAAALDTARLEAGRRDEPIKPLSRARRVEQRAWYTNARLVGLAIIDWPRRHKRVTVVGLAALAALLIPHVPINDLKPNKCIGFNHGGDLCLALCSGSPEWQYTAYRFPLLEFGNCNAAAEEFCSERGQRKLDACWGSK